MKSNQQLVEEFHKAFKLPVSDVPTIPSIEEIRLRVRLMREEFKEVREATFGLMDANDAIYRRIENVAKELVDLLYVTYGTGLTWGIDLDKLFVEVHKSNMSKLMPDGTPRYRDDGKVLKGPNYYEPDVRSVLGLITAKEEDIHEDS